jgi:hexosaminidase
MKNIKLKSLHLDSARSFIPLDELYERVKELSELGFSHLQLGLSDDQGWRFESKKYPLLHKKGAFRDRMILTSRPSSELDEIPYGGFYKQSELKSLVKYAKTQKIEIIPLLNIPGHSTASIYAYPELSSGGVVDKMTSLRGAALYKSRVSTICYTSDFTKTFVKELFHELMDVFPGDYIHLGFDEIAHGTCIRCGNCNPDTLTELLDLVQTEVLKRNRKPIIWWRKEKHAIDVSRYPELTLQWWGASSLYKGKFEVTNDVIFSQPANLYFDYPESVGGRLTILDDMGTTLVNPHGLLEKSLKFPDNVIGIGACLWSENLYTEDLRDDHLYPRLKDLSSILNSVKLEKPSHRMGSWISSSYVTSLVKLIRNSSLTDSSKNILKHNMDNMTMSEFLEFLTSDYPEIEFKSIPLSKVSNSVINSLSIDEWDKIKLLYN